MFLRVKPWRTSYVDSRFQGGLARAAHGACRSLEQRHELATCPRFMHLNAELCGVISGAAMVSSSSSCAKLADTWRNRAISVKAISFALIGAVNTVVDYSVFLLARAALKEMMATLALFAALSGDRETVLLVAANACSWLVAMTGSYIMNSSITFAVESGRKLRWRAYAAFAVSGIAGLLANTVMLIFGAQVLLFPIWIAKAVAILASFVVNFSLSHFVVFRAHGDSWPDASRRTGAGAPAGTATSVL